MRRFSNAQRNAIKSGITVVSRSTGQPVGYTIPHKFYRYTSAATRVSEMAVIRGRTKKG